MADDIFVQVEEIAKSVKSQSDLTPEAVNLLIDFFADTHTVQLKESKQAIELIGYTFINNEFFYTCRNMDCSTFFISASNISLFCYDIPQHAFLYVI